MGMAAVTRGATPRRSSAPWWALAAVVVGGIILLSLLGFVPRWLAMGYSAVAQGPRGIYVMLVVMTTGLLQIALLVRVVSSWVRVSPYSPWVRWSYVVTDPILRPLARIIPPLGMMDVTPIVAYLLINYVLTPLLLGVVS